MTETVPPPPAPPSRKKLVIGTAAALGVAAVALVGFVLPAEYGIDPTGAGAALGLTELAQKGEENHLPRARPGSYQHAVPARRGSQARRSHAAPDAGGERRCLAGGVRVRTDRFTFDLLPYEGIELKYDLAQGAPMIFAWKASAPVYLDMHSHPFAGGTDLTESFVIDQLSGQTGVYVAPFTGIHGWYWQNRTLEPVTLTLDTLGAFTASRTFDAAGEHPRPLADEPETTP